MASLVLEKLVLSCPKTEGGTSDMGDSGIASDPTSMSSPGIAGQVVSLSRPGVGGHVASLYSPWV